SAAAVAVLTIGAAPNTIAAGGTVILTITAKDAFNNLASDVVHFSSTDTQVAAGNGLPANSAVTNGSGTFTATLRTAGIQTVTVSDSLTSSISALSNNVTVAAGAVKTLTVSAAPTSITAGGTTVLTVTAKDQFGN